MRESHDHRVECLEILKLVAPYQSMSSVSEYTFSVTQIAVESCLESRLKVESSDGNKHSIAHWLTDCLERGNSNAQIRIDALEVWTWIMKISASYILSRENAELRAHMLNFIPDTLANESCFQSRTAAFHAWRDGVLNSPQLLQQLYRSSHPSLRLTALLKPMRAFLCNWKNEFCESTKLACLDAWKSILSSVLMPCSTWSFQAYFDALILLFEPLLETLDNVCSETQESTDLSAVSLAFEILNELITHSREWTMKTSRFGGKRSLEISPQLIQTELYYKFINWAYCTIEFKLFQCGNTQRFSEDTQRNVKEVLMDVFVESNVSQLMWRLKAFENKTMTIEEELKVSKLFQETVKAFDALCSHGVLCLGTKQSFIERVLEEIIRIPSHLMSIHVQSVEWVDKIVQKNAESSFMSSSAQSQLSWLRYQSETSVSLEERDGSQNTSHLKLTFIENLAIVWLFHSESHHAACNHAETCKETSSLNDGFKLFLDCALKCTSQTISTFETLSAFLFAIDFWWQNWKSFNHQHGAFKNETRKTSHDAVVSECIQKDHKMSCEHALHLWVLIAEQLEILFEKNSSAMYSKETKEQSLFDFVSDTSTHSVEVISGIFMFVPRILASYVLESSENQCIDDEVSMNEQKVESMNDRKARTLRNGCSGRWLGTWSALYTEIRFWLASHLQQDASLTRLILSKLESDLANEFVQCLQGLTPVEISNWKSSRLLLNFCVHCARLLVQYSQLNDDDSVKETKVSNKWSSRLDLVRFLAYLGKLILPKEVLALREANEQQQQKEEEGKNDVKSLKKRKRSRNSRYGEALVIQNTLGVSFIHILKLCQSNVDEMLTAMEIMNKELDEWLLHTENDSDIAVVMLKEFFVLFATHSGAYAKGCLPADAEKLLLRLSPYLSPLYYAKSRSVRVAAARCIQSASPFVKLAHECIHRDGLHPSLASVFVSRVSRNESGPFLADESSPTSSGLSCGADAGQTPTNHRRILAPVIEDFSMYRAGSRSSKMLNAVLSSAITCGRPGAWKESPKDHLRYVSRRESPTLGSKMSRRKLVFVSDSPEMKNEQDDGIVVPERNENKSSAPRVLKRKRTASGFLHYRHGINDQEGRTTVRLKRVRFSIEHNS